LIKKHLDLVKQIAKNKDGNTLAPSLDLSNLDGYGRLAIFVKHDATTILWDAREKTHKKRNAREAIFSSGGTNIANGQRYHMDVKQTTDDDDNDNDVDQWVIV
jgi:hypothetical protein